jgi:D-3-phosphoglycerate dehydrogenase / 2-oxoglutarate reductase
MANSFRKNQSQSVLVLDFDSTFTKVEALDELARRIGTDDPERAKLITQIKDLTDKAMAGDLSFAEALSTRIALLRPSRQEIDDLADWLKTQVSDSIIRNRHVFADNPDRIFILSGGFHDFIDPVVADFGISESQVLANRLVYDDNEIAIGIDTTNPLSRDGGKSVALLGLNLLGPIIMIGDGYTDFEVLKDGACDRFYGFTETIARPKVMAAISGRLDAKLASSFDEILHLEGIEGRYSFPRSKIKVLLLENIHPEAVRAFVSEGYDVETHKGALDETALKDAIKGVHILGIRSKTEVSAEVLAAADKLMAIGAFCIGTNQIDLKASLDKGIAVFNAPYSNTRSVVEMVMGLIVALRRDLFDKSQKMHNGQWDKSANGAFEVRGKTLGIIGYGAIGSQLSILAESFGMRVIYYDLEEKLTLGNARRYRSLDALLGESDVVSIHVDGRGTNNNFFGAAQFSRMKRGAHLINLSRGHVVDIEALQSALKSGQIGGAAIDVFPEEPRTNQDPFECPLRGLNNVILTPHIGGSTEEAQEAIARFASERLLNFIGRGDTHFSVNMPDVSLAEVEGRHRFLHLHKNIPGVLAQINQIMAHHKLNILGQQLATNADLGYVIVDVDKGYPKEALEDLKNVKGTLKFRSLS